MPAPDASAQRATDLAACGALLRTGSHSFAWASRLLPAEVGEAATALYAFCRVADDCIDLCEGDQSVALAGLGRQLDRVYAGQPADDAVERLLAAVVAEYQLPRVLLDALLEGFAWDAAGRRYRTIGEVRAYSARVAGSVGAMMTLLMGVRARPVLARACDLGVAMQLTNIARDVGEDARAGRLYLPLDWLEEAGVDPVAWLAEPVFTPALGVVIERLLAEADTLYARASSGIAGLPARCRPGIHAARLLYHAIGEDLRAHGHDSLARRAHVASTGKVRLVATALWAATRPAPGAAAAPLEETRFLVEAVPDDGTSAPRPGRVEWLLELFERLQERDQLAAGAR